MTTAYAMDTAVAPEVEVEGSESRVDRDSHFNGLYQTKQNLRIEGSAEGSIECEGTLTVVEGARVKAEVIASMVTIAGYLEGEVVCKDIFQIMPPGEVKATVSARRLIVNEGGIFNGVFHMIEAGAETPTVTGLTPDTETATDEAVPQESDAPGEDADQISSPGLLSTDDWWAKLTGNDSPTNSDDSAT